MSEMRAVLGGGSRYEFDGRVYKLSGWEYGILEEFTDYLIGQGWASYNRSRKYLPPDEAQSLRLQVQRDVAAGEYEYGGAVFAGAVFNQRHLRRFAHLLLHFAGEAVSDADVERMQREDGEGLLAAVLEANADPSFRSRVRAGVGDRSGSGTSSPSSSDTLSTSPTGTSAA